MLSLPNDLQMKYWAACTSYRRMPLEELIAANLHKQLVLGMQNN